MVNIFNNYFIKLQGVFTFFYIYKPGKKHNNNKRTITKRPVMEDILFPLVN